jgi:hypothetical protein
MSEPQLGADYDPELDDPDDDATGYENDAEIDPEVEEVTEEPDE